MCYINHIDSNLYNTLVYIIVLEYLYYIVLHIFFSTVYCISFEDISVILHFSLHKGHRESIAKVPLGDILMTLRGFASSNDI